MARTVIRIKLDKAAIRRLAEGDGQEVDRAVRRAAGRARDYARANLTSDGNIDTGRLRNSVETQRAPSSSRPVNYEVGTRLEYGIYLEAGTRDHGPVRAKVLRFKPKGAGGFIFRPRVRGIRATRWLSRVLSRLSPNDFT